MENWQANKHHYDGYWGKLHNKLQRDKHKFNDIKEEWLDLFKFECGGIASYAYILDGETVYGDFIQYTNDKNHYLQKRLVTYVTLTTDAIIDLGSGWGRHGIQLSFNNPKYTNIICGELSDGGRGINEYFIKKYNLPIETFSFNWQDHQSLIDLLKDRNYKEIVIFTSNTIEQIPYLNEEVFTDLIDLPIDKISVIHIEPVAFQYNSTEFPFDNHYNRNLKNVLDNIEKKQLIEIKEIVHQYYGHSTNSTSQNNILIEWIKI